MTQYTLQSHSRQLNANNGAVAQARREGREGQIRANAWKDKKGKDKAKAMKRNAINEKEREGKEKGKEWKERQGQERQLKGIKTKKEGQ